jgi:vanillate O-demethylase monooxygenase subunit
VVERDRYLWIWMGDAALADPDLIPDAHWLTDPDWRALPG